MSPQFVDYDADGDLDLVAGTFDGSPHLARRDGDAFLQPEQILDAEGVRIVLHQYWDHDANKWTESSRGDLPGQPAVQGHGTSAIAFDDDGDGDLDLLLGDHKSGHVYRRENRGTAKAPAYARGNELLLADGKAIDVPGTVATLRLVDWDHDGRQDLLFGSMGDAYGEAAGGGVFWCRNVGDGKAARFGPLQTLVPPSPKGHTEATRPDAGLYPEAADLDGDGDLDLVVGAYSQWTPKGRTLTAAEQQRVATIRSELQALDAELEKLNQVAQAVFTEVQDEQEANKRYAAAFKAQKKERDQLRERREPLETELQTLVPSKQRRAFVWLYENTTKR